MGIYRKIVGILVLVLAGCAATPVPPECKTEYAHTISYCPPPPRRDPTPAECKAAGNVQVYRDGDYVGCAHRDTFKRDMMDRRRR
jgi:hypothetical protein